MEIEFDTAKNAENIALRGLSFELVAGFDFEGALIRQDTRKAYGEDRFQAVGLIGSKLFFVVFTMRGNAVRVISLRRANQKERKLYDQAQS